MTKKKSSDEDQTLPGKTGPIHAANPGDLGSMVMAYGAPPPLEQDMLPPATREQRPLETEHLAPPEDGPGDTLNMILLNLTYCAGLLKGLRERPGLELVGELASAATKIEEAGEYLNRSRHKLK